MRRCYLSMKYLLKDLHSLQTPRTFYRVESYESHKEYPSDTTNMLTLCTAPNSASGQTAATTRGNKLRSEHLHAAQGAP